MKRTLSFMVMAFALLFTQCRKPEVKFPTPSAADEGTTVSMTITAGPGSKTDINGTTGAITWSANDKIYVGYDGKYVGCLEIQNGVGNATGTFSGEVTLTDASDGVKTFGFFYLGSGDYTSLTKGTSTEVAVSFATQEIYANGTNLSDDAKKFHVGYGSANGTVTDGVVTDIKVTLVSKIALAYFSFTKNDAPYPYKLTLSGDNIYNDMTVNFSGKFTGKTKDTISLTGSHSKRYVMLVPPANVASETLNFSGGATGSTTFENGIEANKFYRIDGNMPIEVKVKGPFTVDERGTTVEFSKGNLQYLGKSDGTGTWRFAEHQWDYMGDGPSGSKPGNVNLTSLGYTAEQYNYGSGADGGSETDKDMASARDLFGWGATGFQDERSHASQTNYQPYSTSNTAAESGTEAYNKNPYGYGPDYDYANKYGLTVADKSDWGCLAIGGDPAGTWRTLIKGEWDYLLNTSGGDFGRTDANRFAKAKVKGVNGMLIFPDGYNGGTAIGGITGVATVNSTNDPYPGSDILPEEWIPMETAGVVFLPAAGYRYGASFGNVGEGGSYWSSSTTGETDSNGKTAYTMYFGVYPNSSVHTYHDDRCVGFAVRLVR